MQIVIDIDENIFTRLFDNGVEDYAIINDDLFAIAKSIRNCIPLPKGHGELKDVDEIWHLYDYNDLDYTMIDALNDAPIIIEADEER